MNKTGEDYGAVSTAESSLDDAGDIRDTTNLVECGSWDNQSGSDIADATAVTWNAGSNSGTLIHMTNANGSSIATDQWMIKCDSTTDCDNLADNDTISDGTNTFDVASTPDSCQVTIEVYDDDGEFTDSFSFFGWTTDVDNFVKVTVPEGERHNGTATGGGAEINFNSINLQMGAAYTVVEWLILDWTVSSTSSPSALLIFPNIAGITGSTVQNIIMPDPTVGGAGFASYAIGCGTVPSLDVNVFNNIVYGCSDNSGCGGFGFGSNCNGNVYNNVSYNNDGDGFADTSSNGTKDFKNNASFNNGGSDYSGSIDIKTTNASSDSTGNSGLTNLTASDQFVDIANNDFHLVGTADLVDAGTDLGTSANVDIDNRDRDAQGDTWDIGADEYSLDVSGWSCYNTITVDNTKVDGSSLHRFPVLVNTTNADWATTANGGFVEQTDGKEILFTNSAATLQYPHEIEEYNATTGELIAWVNVPALSGTSDTDFRIYYGNNAGSLDEEQVSATWSSAFVGVWHLAEDPSTTADGDCAGAGNEVCDSTIYNNDAEAEGAISSNDSVAGQIYNGVEIDGSFGESLDAGSDASLDDTWAGGATVSIWANVDDIAHETLFDKNNSTWKIWFQATTDNVWFRQVEADTGNPDWHTDSSTIAINTWYYIGMYYDSDSTSNDPIFYIDGESVNVTEDTAPDSALASDNAGNFAIGARADGDNAADGVMDEARYRTGFVDPNVIKTEYNNQSSPSTFYTVGTTVGCGLIDVPGAINFDGIFLDGVIAN